MTRIKSTYLALVAVLLSPMAANAVPITYEVNSTIGPGFVVGTITTDGTIGVLAGGNILDFSLTLNDGTDQVSFSLGGPGFSAFQIGGPPFDLFSATATQLLFDFTDPGAGFAAFQHLAGDDNWIWGFQNGGGCECELIVHRNTTDGIFHDIRNENVEGVVVVAEVVAVPEPGTLALLGIGLAVMGLARRRRKV